MDRRTFLRSGGLAAGAVVLSPASSPAATDPALGPRGQDAADGRLRSAPAADTSGCHTGEHRRGGEHGAVRTGFDTLAETGYAELRGQRVGLVSNPTGVVRDLRHEADVLAATDEVDLVGVFGPEHGFRGHAEAGGSRGSYRDPRTGVPVYDTYGKDPAAIAGLLRDARLDTLVFDIQDVGARFYTYIWTMYDCMVAASRAGVRFVVLDRPNPIGAVEAHGPVLRRRHATFVGRRPIAQQHGMTVGELAGLFNTRFLPADQAAAGPVDLAVSRMSGWRRDLYGDETGQPWVMPSPNMPRVETAVVYPGTCLFEATNMSEGRGTSRPFELVGAPYADHRWAQALGEEGLEGVDFREAYFVPFDSKHRDRTCAGVQLHVTDRSRFDAIRTAVAMLVTARHLYGADVAWRESAPPYWIDKLTGSEQVRRAIDAGEPVEEVVAGWEPGLAAFRRVREQHLLYPTVGASRSAG